MGESETAASPPPVERRSAGWSAELLPPLPLDHFDPVESLRRCLALCAGARMFVAAFRMDMQRLEELAVDTLPDGVRAALMERLALARERPPRRFSRLYGHLTALSRPERPADARARLVPPLALPEEYTFLLESASRRKDDAVPAYWVPLSAVERGSITVIDPATVREPSPLVVFRLEEGSLEIVLPLAADEVAEA